MTWTSTNGLSRLSTTSGTIVHAEYVRYAAARGYTCTVTSAIQSSTPEADRPTASESRYATTLTTIK